MMFLSFVLNEFAFRYNSVVGFMVLWALKYASSCCNVSGNHAMKTVVAFFAAVFAHAFHFAMADT